MNNKSLKILSLLSGIVFTKPQPKEHIKQCTIQVSYVGPNGVQNTCGNNGDLISQEIMNKLYALKTRRNDTINLTMANSSLISLNDGYTVSKFNKPVMIESNTRVQAVYWNHKDELENSTIPYSGCMGAFFSGQGWEVCDPEIYKYIGTQAGCIPQEQYPYGILTGKEVRQICPPGQVCPKPQMQGDYPVGCPEYFLPTVDATGCSIPQLDNTILIPDYCGLINTHCGGELQLGKYGNILSCKSISSSAFSSCTSNGTVQSYSCPQNAPFLPTGSLPNIFYDSYSNPVGVGSYSVKSFLALHGDYTSLCTTTQLEGHWPGEYGCDANQMCSTRPEYIKENNAGGLCVAKIKHRCSSSSMGGKNQYFAGNCPSETPLCDDAFIVWPAFYNGVLCYPISQSSIDVLDLAEAVSAMLGVDISTDPKMITRVQDLINNEYHGNKIAMLTGGCRPYHQGGVLSSACLTNQFCHGQSLPVQHMYDNDRLAQTTVCLSDMDIAFIKTGMASSCVPNYQFHQFSPIIENTAFIDAFSSSFITVCPMGSSCYKNNIVMLNTNHGEIPMCGDFNSTFYNYNLLHGTWTFFVFSLGIISLSSIKTILHNRIHSQVFALKFSSITKLFAKDHTLENSEEGNLTESENFIAELCEEYCDRELSQINDDGIILREEFEKQIASHEDKIKKLQKKKESLESTDQEKGKEIDKKIKKYTNKVTQLKNDLISSKEANINQKKHELNKRKQNMRVILIVDYLLFLIFMPAYTINYLYLLVEYVHILVNSYRYGTDPQKVNGVLAIDSTISASSALAGLGLFGTIGFVQNTLMVIFYFIYNFADINWKFKRNYPKSTMEHLPYIIYTNALTSIFALCLAIATDIAISK